MISSLESSAVPVLGGVLETALYAHDLAAAERFYAGVLALEKIQTVPGRLLVFQCQESILLIFDPRRTEADPILINGGAVPLHGARGPGHAAFRVPENAFAAWRLRLHHAGVPIESEVRWPNGASSIYFRDPAGNSLELATPNMWGPRIEHQ